MSSPPQKTNKQFFLSSLEEFYSQRLRRITRAFSTVCQMQNWSRGTRVNLSPKPHANSAHHVDRLRVTLKRHTNTYTACSWYWPHTRSVMLLSQNASSCFVRDLGDNISSEDEIWAWCKKKENIKGFYTGSNGLSGFAVKSCKVS